ncbi:MAG: hypothetical protein EXQ94_11085 [Alphaproteobacteria bacterium]|nr:hypothetical protein [Alphaproteobacteria bacterium]
MERALRPQPGAHELLPLIAGAASPDQAKALVERHLLNEREFWGEWVAPSVSRDDPAFADNVYWRGRVWPPLNIITYYGLRRAGFADVAREFARRSHRLFMRNWETDRHCGENFSAVTGEIRDQPDTDWFYAWGALLTLIEVAETIDVDPWEGWTLTNRGEDVAIGPIVTPVGTATVTVRDGCLTLVRNDEPIFVTDARGRWRGLRIGRERFEAIAPADPSGSRWFTLPSVRANRIRSATCDGHPLAADGNQFRLPTGGGTGAIAFI